jgi:hypothetical protein
MRVHWAAKWMSIPYGDTTVLIQGVLSELLEGAVVQICQLTDADIGIDNSDDSDHSDMVTTIDSVSEHLLCCSQFSSTKGLLTLYTLSPWSSTCGY